MEETNRQKIRPKNNTVLVTMEDVHFQWSSFAIEKNDKQSNNNFIIKIQAFSIARHQFIGVTGDKNSGKTTLLYSIIGHTHVLKGNMRLRGTQIFFPKIPFVHPGSIKSNIIMESDFDSALYVYNNIIIYTQKNV